jgi:hypothetical protein
MEYIYLNPVINKDYVAKSFSTVCHSGSLPAGRSLSRKPASAPLCFILYLYVRESYNAFNDFNLIEKEV